MLPRKGRDGVYEFQWANLDLSTVLTAVSPERDTGSFVRALLAAPPGTVLLGEADPTTVGKYVEMWSQVTGRTARFSPITGGELEALVDSTMPSFGKEMAENLQYYRDFTYTGSDPAVIRAAALDIDLKGLTTLRQFLSETDWSSLLAE